MSERRFARTPGAALSPGLHVVWCPRYRRRILAGRVARRLTQLGEQIADEHGWRIVDKEVMPDRVHRFVRVVPADAPASVRAAFECRTARVMRRGFSHLGDHAKVLWLPSYFAAWVGDSWQSTVRRCIEHRWDAVMAL